TLVAHGIRPDHLASYERTVTQAIARKIHDNTAGYPGFRWWSALTGDWHAAVVFLDHVHVRDIGYGDPDPAHVGHPAVLEAARFLRMK
ncbi:MAG TPA: hypothetical protein VEW03_12730, partial [Longimicrobiaceae bacterium]|nr:hypothetical protein [Longimicrobiaceae bacterium]